MNWKDKLDELLKSGCTDSDIENFLDDNPNIDEGEVWDYVYEYDAPEVCKGCKYIQFRGMYPCNICSRVHTKDFYMPR